MLRFSKTRNIKDIEAASQARPKDIQRQKQPKTLSTRPRRALEWKVKLSFALGLLLLVLAF
jgi:hypothetical protein